MGSTSRSRTALPPAEASLEREAALLVSSQTTPPSACVFNIDGFFACSGFFVIENDVFLGVHSRVRVSQVAEDEIVSCVNVGLAHSLSLVQLYTPLGYPCVG